MNKPVPIILAPAYNLNDVLDYINEFVPKFKKKAWKELCNLGYISNDTTTSIYWEGLIDKDTDDEVLDGITKMFEEFPDIKEGNVIFEVSW
jgi:hypothetical protein